MFVIQNVTVFRERVFYPYFRIEKPFFHLIFFFLLFFFWVIILKEVKQINEKQHLTGDALVLSQLTTPATRRTILVSRRNLYKLLAVSPPVMSRQSPCTWV